MGVQRIDGAATGEALRRFSARLLADLRALERLIEDGRCDGGVRHIGAEQEVFLVDEAWRAAPVIHRVLDALEGAPGFVPELGSFQAEINLDPVPLGPSCLSSLHSQLDRRLARLRIAAARAGARLAMVGVLPTLRRGDACAANLTARPRYSALTDAVRRLRGGAVDVRIEGTDELWLRDDTVMLEAATCSFQVHLQVDARGFAPTYNAAQAIAGLQLAAAANAPLVFGQRLWNESRVPLFQQVADTRRASRDVATRPARVTFGTRWLEASPVEVFREDLARFPVLLVADDDEDPEREAAAGRAPSLTALRIHTSTVYRWNRVCYGTTDGAPHLRIENRALPSGPTTLDEVANAAFWVGLVTGVVREYGDVGRRMAFDGAKANFLTAARAGLGADLAWVDGRVRPAAELLRGEAIPLARVGLRALGVGADEAERYLAVLDARVATGRTGARWMLASDAALRESGGTRGEQLAAITAGLVARGDAGEPVHTWRPATLGEAGGPRAVWATVDQVMTTDVPTIRDEDAVALARATMDWLGVEQLAVEDESCALVGLITRAAIDAASGPTRAVRELMTRDPVVVPPEAPTVDALAAMHARGARCVLVAREGTLLGLLDAATLAASASRGR